MPRAQLVGPFPAGVEPVEYDQLRRRVLWSMPSGLYLLSSRADDERNLMTLSFVSQFATEPKLLGVGVEREAVSAALISKSGVFGLVVLARSQRELLRRFVKPAEHDAFAHTLSGTPYTDAPVTGVPVPDFAAAFIDCQVTEEHVLGSHLLFLGEVVDISLADPDVLLAPLRMEDTRMSYGG